MSKKEKLLRELSTALSYVLVVALTVVITLFLTNTAGNTPEGGKLQELQQLLEECYIDIDKVDLIKMEDAAANAMVDALGDRWSYYISAEDYAANVENSKNSYVGIGVTIAVREGGDGFTVEKIEPGSGAQKAGIRPGDILIEVDGVSIIGKSPTECRNLVRGKIGTTLQVGVLRGEEKCTFTVERQLIQTQVVQEEMLPGNIGLVVIRNFNERCYAESKAAVDRLVSAGAKALIFDVRNNPGGYKNELVKLLDYLLPKGDLFKSVDYTGAEYVDRSDDKCLELPMAVLINSESYSAAEFFAAALEEYDWAITVGDPTCGKGNFQYTFQFSDGSGIGLSVGKYYTPKGVSLAEQGGLIPKVLVEVDDKTAAMIYAGLVEPADDPQIQAAVQTLQNGVK